MKTKYSLVLPCLNEFDNLKILIPQIMRVINKFRYEIVLVDDNSEDQTKWQRIRFDTPYLKEPLQYDMNILPKNEFVPYMKQHLQFIAENLDDADKHKFSILEYEKFRRVVDYMASTNYTTERVQEGRRDFYNWFTEYDKRRNVDFVNVFPELEGFYNDCAK